MMKIKRLGLITILILATTFIQSYWAMYAYRNNQDSYSMKNSYFTEILYTSLLFTVLLFPVVLAISFLNRIKKYQTNIFLILLVPVWFFINYGNFDGRVASWSTYLPSEILGAVFFHSFLPMIICSILFVFLYKKIQNKYETI